MQRQLLMAVVWAGLVVVGVVMAVVAVWPRGRGRERDKDR